MKRERGFTLIELLVVISIIGVLSSVVLASLNYSRAKARDAKRLSDIRQIQIALEQYYNDNGKYPSSNSSTCNSTTDIPNSAWCNSVQSYSGSRWIAGGALAPYLPFDPTDPAPDPTAVWGGSNNDGGTYFYYSPSNAAGGCAGGQLYIIVAGMEITANRKMTFKYCDGTPYTMGGTYIVGQSVP